jgi:hypothetical protein
LVIVLLKHSESKLGMARLLGPLLLICGAGGGSYPKRVMRMRLVVTYSGIEVAVGRVLNITPTPDGVVIVQNEWDGRLKTWMIPSIETLRWLIHEATAGETPPSIYHLPPLNSIVLEREQVERFHIVARPYEIKTRNEGV